MVHKAEEGSIVDVTFKIGIEGEGRGGRVGCLYIILTIVYASKS